MPGIRLGAVVTVDKRLERFREEINIIIAPALAIFGIIRVVFRYAVLAAVIDANNSQVDGPVTSVTTLSSVPCPASFSTSSKRPTEVPHLPRHAVKIG